MVEREGAAMGKQKKMAIYSTITPALTYTCIHPKKTTTQDVFSYIKEKIRKKRFLCFGFFYNICLFEEYKHIYVQKEVISSQMKYIIL